MKIVNESIQMIHIDSSTKLTPSMINQTLLKAFSNKMYAKFYTDKYYIQVDFMRDNSIMVASNIRNSSFLYDYYKNAQAGWTFARVKAFVYQWMQVSRSSLW